MTWPSHDLIPQQTSRHQNISLPSTKHHHHGTAESSFTAKKWFGHRAGRSPCTHSIGKFFLWLIVFFLWNFRPRLVRALLVYEPHMVRYIPSKPQLHMLWPGLPFYSKKSLIEGCERTQDAVEKGERCGGVANQLMMVKLCDKTERIPYWRVGQEKNPGRRMRK